MTNIAKWGTPALTTVLSTELNSLASGGIATSGSHYDNTTNGYLYCDIEVNLAALSPASPANVTIYFLGAIDGTNFPAPTQPDATQQNVLSVVTIPLGTTASTAQRVVARHIPLIPVKFDIALVSGAGVALGASGNTVKLLAYGQNFNG